MTTSQAATSLYEKGIRYLRECLAERLRRIRRECGMSALELSLATGIHVTRISRIERGHLTPRVDELQLMLSSMSVSADDRADIDLFMEELDQQQLWKVIDCSRPIDELQLEAWANVEAATNVKEVRLFYVPGLLQTSSYVHTIFRRAFPRKSEAEWRAATQVRLNGQHVLFDLKRNFEFVLMDSMFVFPVAEPLIMAAQCDRILQLSQHDNISVSIIPAGVPTPYVDIVSFGIFGDVLEIDNGVGYMHTRSRRSVAIFKEIYKDCHAVALHDDDARLHLMDWSTKFSRMAAEAGGDRVLVI